MDTPVFSGEEIVVYIPKPICDIIIGNVHGVHPEDTRWKLGKTRIGLINDSPIFRNKTTTEREALGRQRKKAQLYCAGHEKREYEATSKVRESIQMVEYAMLEKDEALVREKQVQQEVAIMKATIQRISLQAASQTCFEEENVKKQCNEYMFHLMEELENKELINVEQQAQIDRAIREKRAVEAELVTLYRVVQPEEGVCVHPLNSISKQCLYTYKNA